MLVEIDNKIEILNLEDKMITKNYAVSKAYQNELIRQAEYGHLLKSAKRSQKKHFSLRQVIQKLSSPKIRTSRGLEFDTL